LYVGTLLSLKPYSVIYALLLDVVLYLNPTVTSLVNHPLVPSTPPDTYNSQLGPVTIKSGTVFGGIPGTF